MNRPQKGSPSGTSGLSSSSATIASQTGNASLPETQPGNGWQTVAVCLFLTAVVWAVFGQTLHHDFVNFDDDVYVYANPDITPGLSWHGVAWAFTHADGPLEWLPLTAISRMLDCQLYGLHPGGHHLTNVLLHNATVILLFLVLRKMTGAFWPAAFVAAVFAIHPLRVESVAWVTERKDVLSGFFFMLTLWAYLRHVQNQQAISNGPGPGDRKAFSFLGSHFYWLALLFFTLGLLSKTMLVTLPFVLLLLDYWPLNRWSSSDHPPASSLLPNRTGLFLEKIPFLLLTVGACAVTVLAQGNAIRSTQALDFSSRIENALVAYAAYLWQMLYPAGLAVFYPHPRNHLTVWNIGLSVLALFLISAGVLAGRRKHPYLLTGWLWYLGMLIPVIGLLQVGIQARADRYTYLPQIGLYILVTWGAVELCGTWRHRRTVLGFAAAAVLAGLLAGAYVQTRYWQNSVSLWTHALTCTTENFMAHNDLGIALAGQGKWTEAIQQYARALQLNPDDFYTHNNLGIALASQGRLTEAIQQYERAIQINPDVASAHNNLGIALADQGKPIEAIEHYDRALQIDPDNAEVQFNLANALADQGELAKAIAHYEQALQIKPDYAEAHSNLGSTLFRQGKLAEAMAHYERALQIKPDYAQAQYNLGNTLAGQGKLPEAVQHYERALQINPDDAVTHNNLGIALASQGKLAEAIQHYERALQLKSDFAEAQYDLGNALAGEDKLTEAIAHYERALQLEPDHASTHVNLGNTLARQGRLTEAVQHYERALQLEPEDALTHNNLAIILTSQGKPAEAIPHFQKALALATTQGNTELAESIRAHLKSQAPGSSQPQKP